jgi:hypothetical protein
MEKNDELKKSKKTKKGQSVNLRPHPSMHL